MKHKITSTTKEGVQISDTLKGFYLRLPKPVGDGKWKCWVNSWGHTAHDMIALGKGYLWFTAYWEGTDGVIIEKPVKLVPAHPFDLARLMVENNEAASKLIASAKRK